MQPSRGFSLIEVIVALGVLSLFFVGVYSGINLLFRVVQQARLQTIETALLTREIELIRNLPYASVGITDGVPSGVLPRLASTTEHGLVFELTRTVRYVDDPFDGVTPADTDPNDYKFVQIDVVCSACGQIQPRSMYTIVSP